MNCTRPSRLTEQFYLIYQFLFQRARPMITLFLPLTMLSLISTSAMAASVSVSWNPNDPTPDGYIILIRADGSDYNDEAPSWVGSATSCRLDGLIPGTTYFMVVRAYVGALQSPNSNEVTFTAEEDTGDATESEEMSNEAAKRSGANIGRSNYRTDPGGETNMDQTNALPGVTQVRITPSD